MMKKLLPLLSFILIVFFCSINNGVSASDVKCPEEIKGTTLLCGNSVDAEGTGSEIMFKGKTENYNNLRIYAATISLTNNSRFNFKDTSQITFESIGCVGDDSACSNEDPSIRPYGGSSLNVNNSKFFHGGSSESEVLMKDRVDFVISNESSVSLGTFREIEKGGKIKENTKFLECDVNPIGGCFTKLTIDVYDSDLSLAGIEFENPYSEIVGIKIKNTEVNRGRYRFTVAQDITAHKIGYLELSNSDVVLNGDVVTYDIYKRDMLGSIEKISLYNSDLVLRGHRFGQTSGAIRLDNGSILKIDPPRDGEHLLVLGTDPSITMNDKSEFIAKDIQINSPTVGFYISSSEMKADKIYFDNSTGQFINFDIDANLESKVAIKEINTILDCTASTCPTTSQRIKLAGDTKSTYEIGTILIDSDMTELNLENTHGTIESIEYLNSYGKIQSLKVFNPEDIVLKIGNINFKNDADKYNLRLWNQNIEITNVNFKKSDSLDINLIDSKVTSKNIICDEFCSKIKFQGSNGSSYTMEKFDAGSSKVSEASNVFEGIKIIVLGSYNSNGTFTAQASTLEFGSLNGDFDGINLEKRSHLTIKGDSNINLVSGKIKIEKDSSFILNGKNSLIGNDINIINNGDLQILQANNFDTLTNSGSAKLDGESNIKKIENTGTLELKNGTSVENLNNENILIVSGTNRAEKYTFSDDSKLIFQVSSRQDHPSLILHEMDPNFNIPDISLRISSISVLKPGLYNRFNLITTEKGNIAIDYETLDDVFKVSPIWLEYKQGLDNNEGGGQTAWVSVQRLTNYTSMVEAVPKYRDDKSTVAIANSIDDAVIRGEVSLAVEDVVNSLDFNSGCNVDDEEDLYTMHNGIQIIDINKHPCLYGLAENINSLKPVSNEVYALYSHTNTVNSLDLLLLANREYVYSNEVYSWYKLDVGYSSLSNKKNNKGFNSINSMVYAGATVAAGNNYNLSGMLGFGIGTLDGTNDVYKGTNNTVIAGIAGSYLEDTYYISLSSVIGLTNFKNDRYIYFMDNDYSLNRDTKAKASISLIEVAVKAEAGNEYALSSTTFITPKVFVSEGFVNNSGYSESGSSASLSVDSSSLLITDVGAGIELRRELLLPSFLGIQKAFWYPKVGLNIVERFYQQPKTKTKFLGTTDETYKNMEDGNYSGVLGQLYGSLLVQHKGVELEVAYTGDASISGYMNHHIMAMLKYSFR